jgi:hypothetical protein
MNATKGASKMTDEIYKYGDPHFLARHFNLSVKRDDETENEFSARVANELRAQGKRTEAIEIEIGGKWSEHRETYDEIVQREYTAALLTRLLSE